MNENNNSSKMEELLLVLEHPELPLHNPAELGARTIVLRRILAMVLKRRMVLRLGIYVPCCYDS